MQVRTWRNLYFAVKGSFIAEYTKASIVKRSELSFNYRESIKFTKKSNFSFYFLSDHLNYEL